MLAPEFSKEGLLERSGSQPELHVRITCGDLKSTDAQIPPQRFQFNWSDEQPGYQEF